MKTRTVLLLWLIPLLSFGQFSLLPNSMKKYVGKVDKSQFEEIIGQPVSIEENGVYVYNVDNAYGNEVTAIRCFYRLTDNKLISVKFGTRHYLGYWINFGNLPDFVGKQHEKVYKEYGNLTKVELKLNGFGCQILDIVETPLGSTAIINYHIIK